VYFLCDRGAKGGVGMRETRGRKQPMGGGCCQKGSCGGGKKSADIASRGEKRRGAEAKGGRGCRGQATLGGAAHREGIENGGNWMCRNRRLSERDKPKKGDGGLTCSNGGREDESCRKGVVVLRGVSFQYREHPKEGSQLQGVSTSGDGEGGARA